MNTKNLIEMEATRNYIHNYEKFYKTSSQFIDKTENLSLKDLVKMGKKLPKRKSLEKFIKTAR